MDTSTISSLLPLNSLLYIPGHPGKLTLDQMIKIKINASVYLYWEYRSHIPINALQYVQFNKYSQQM